MRIFYLSPERWQEPYLLDESESRHASSVLRMRPGDELEALDGKGRTGRFRIAAISKREVRLEKLDDVRITRPAGATLAIGYGRDVRRSWLLEKAVELEADAVWFWQADRSQGKVPDAEKETWKAQLIAGAKQSRNPFLPELRTFPDGLAALLREAGGFSRALVPHESASAEDLLVPADLSSPGSCLFVIGPEGGFSRQESDLLASSSVRAVSLGQRVLRWETAALLCLGACWWVRQANLPCHGREKRS